MEHAPLNEIRIAMQARSFSTAADASADVPFADAFARGLARLPIVFVNVYFVGAPGEPWVLVDAGLPGSAPLIRRVAEARYGSGARPEAIVLTHGHVDHAGSARPLAEAWDAPVYAHPLELPYLTGQSGYAPKDPTVGGAMATVARLLPNRTFDLSGHVHPLPDDGTVPHLPAWRWVHTPGHTAGHVSLWRDEDAVLVAGDALATMDLDAWSGQLTHRRVLSRPPAPFTPDWPAALESVNRLADLDPHTIAAGHGRPITRTILPGAFRTFALRLQPPPHGRYSAEPARADERGVVAVPPPVPDPLPKMLASASAGFGLGLLAGLGQRR